MSWILEDRRLPGTAVLEQNGSRFLSANGVIGLRGTLDESRCSDKAAVVLNGIYDQVPGAWREPVNAPHPLFVRLRQGEEVLGAGSDRVRSHVQSIDYRHGVQHRTTEWALPCGGKLTMGSRRFVYRDGAGQLHARVELSSTAPCTLSLEWGIDREVWDINGPHLHQLTPLVQGRTLSVHAKTGELGIPVAVAVSSRGLGESEPELRHDDGLILHATTLALKPGVPVSLELAAAVCVGERGQDPSHRAAEASKLVGAWILQSFDRWEAAQIAAWDEAWGQADVVIQGDAAAQEGMRFSLYHLLSLSSPAGGRALSIPARGLSGQVYKGAVFWDTELFMLPFFAASFPTQARELVRYRINTLDGARRKAAEYGYRGAFYAWESQETGDDACTLFNVNDVFTGRPMRTFFRDRQIHISGDVAWSIGLYASRTGDRGIYRQGGAEVILECARFFLSWIHWHADKGRWVALDVTGPDEYHERVHNDHFTNRMIQETFRLAVELADPQVGITASDPAWWEALLDRLDYHGDLDRVREVLPRFHVPQPDPRTGVIPQFDDYLDLEEVSLPTLLERKLHPHEYLGGGNGLARWTRIIKQADVVLTQWMFPRDHGTPVRAANWDFYEPRTEHGSSLSACAYAIGAARTGRGNGAYKYFLKTARTDIAGDSKQYVGYLYIGGTHPAANGGAWLSLVEGFAGLQADGEEIFLDPHLPSAWEGIAFKYRYRGWNFAFSIDHDRVEVGVLTRPDTQEAPLSINLSGQRTPVGIESSITLRHKDTHHAS